MLGRLVAEHRLREPNASALKPVLPPSGGLGTKDQETYDPCEAEPEQAGNDAADDRPPVSVSHFRKPLRAQIDLLALHRRNLGADRIHVLLAAIGLNNGERRGLLPRSGADRLSV